MKRECWATLIAGVGLVSMLPAGAGAGEIGWVSSYGDAKKIAKEKNTLMMIDFWATW